LKWAFLSEIRGFIGNDKFPIEIKGVFDVTSFDKSYRKSIGNPIGNRKLLKDFSPYSRWF